MIDFCKGKLTNKDTSDTDTKEVQELKQKVDSLQKKIKYLEESRDNEDEELNISGIQDSQDSDEDYDDIDDLPTIQISKKVRASISAECLSSLQLTRPTEVKRPEKEYKAILELLKKCFIFKTIDPEDHEIVVNVMQTKKVKDGEQLIKQGDDGNEL